MPEGVGGAGWRGAMGKVRSTVRAKSIKYNLNKENNGWD